MHINFTKPRIQANSNEYYNPTLLGKFNANSVFESHIDRETEKQVILFLCHFPHSEEGKAISKRRDNMHHKTIPPMPTARRLTTKNENHTGLTKKQIHVHQA